MCLQVTEIPEYEKHGWIKAWKVVNKFQSRVSLTRGRYKTHKTLRAPFRTEYVYTAGWNKPTGTVRKRTRKDDAILGGVLHVYTTAKAARDSGWCGLVIPVWIKSQDVLAYGISAYDGRFEIRALAPPQIAVRRLFIEKKDYDKVLKK